MRLFARVGFRLTRVIPAAAPQGIVEGVTESGEARAG
jgi:hypothetical protein